MGLFLNIRRDDIMKKTLKRTNSIKNKGFTLVELIVIMVILSIIAAISIMGINAWQDWAFFNSANTSAETIFVDAQDQLTAMSLGGGLDALKARMEQAESTDPGVGKLDITALKSESGGTYTYETLFPESSGKTDPAKYQEEVWYVKTSSGDYDRYLNNPASVGEGAKIVFELLSPTIKDHEILNSSICLEFTTLDGQMFGALYSDRVGGLSYDDASSNTYDSVSVLDRQRDYRSNYTLGFYGAETLAKAQKGRNVEQLEWIEIHNEETLYVAFDGEDHASRDYVLDICDDKTLNPILEIAIEGSALNTRPANDEIQAISCETKRYNDDGTFAELGKIDYPVWYVTEDGKTKVILVLDAADISASGEKYLEYLRSAGEDFANLKSTADFNTSGLKSKNFITSYSFARFGFPLDSKLYATVGLKGMPASSHISTKDLDDSKAGLRDAVACFDQSTVRNEGDAKYTYNILNGRHLYNIRYLEMYNSCLEEKSGKTVMNALHFDDFKGRPGVGENEFVILKDIDWMNFANTKKGVFDSRKLLKTANISYKDGTPVNVVNAPFISIEKLYEKDVLRGDTASVKLLNFSIKQTVDQTILRNGSGSMRYLPVYNEGEVGTVDTTTGSQANYHKTKVLDHYEEVYPVGLVSENFGTIEELVMDGIVVEAERVSSTDGLTQIGGSIAGAFCGVNYGTLQKLKLYSNYTPGRDSLITGEKYVGGIFGSSPILYRKNNDDTYSLCTDKVPSSGMKAESLENHALVKANRYGGGIVGYLYTDRSAASNIKSFTLQNCISVRVARPADKKAGETPYDAKYLGGIVGYMENGGNNNTDLIVKNCRVMPLTSDALRAAAESEYNNLTDPKDRIALVGDYVGGIAGGNEAGFIERCKVTKDWNEIKGGVGNTGAIVLSAEENSDKNGNRSYLIGGDFVGGIAGSLEYRKTVDANNYVVPAVNNYVLPAGKIGDEVATVSENDRNKVNILRIAGVNYVGGVVGLADTGSDIDFVIANDTNNQIYAVEYSAGGIAGSCFSIQLLNCLDDDHHFIKYSETNRKNSNSYILPGRVISRAISGGLFGTVFVGDNDPTINPSDTAKLRSRNTDGVYKTAGTDEYKEHPYNKPIADDKIESGYEKDAYIVKIGKFRNVNTKLYAASCSGGYAGYVEVFSQDKGNYSGDYAKSFAASARAIHEGDTSTDNSNKYNRKKPIVNFGVNNANGYIKYFNLTCDFLLVRQINELKGINASDPNYASAGRYLLFDGIDSYKDANYDNMVEEVFVPRIYTTFLAGGMIGMTERYSPISIEDLCLQQKTVSVDGDRVFGCDGPDNSTMLETHGADSEVTGINGYATGIPDKYVVSRNDVHVSYYGSVSGRINEGTTVRHCQGWCQCATFSGWTHGGICSVNAGRLENCVATSITVDTRNSKISYNDLLSHVGGLCYYNGSPEEDHPAVIINCKMQNGLRLYGRRGLGGFVEENGPFGIIELNRNTGYKAELEIRGNDAGFGAGMIVGQNAGRVIINIPNSGNTATNICYTDGTIHTRADSNPKNNSAGGFIGKNKSVGYGDKGWHTGVIINVNNTPIVNKADVSLVATVDQVNSAGGIVGEATGEFVLSNAHNEGNISASGNAGGIVGFRREYSTNLKKESAGYENLGQSTKLELRNCSNEGNINGYLIAGGIVGEIKYAHPTAPGVSVTGEYGTNCTDQIIEGVTNIGNVSGNRYCGGILGFIGWPERNADAGGSQYLNNVKIIDAVNGGQVVSSYDVGKMGNEVSAANYHLYSGGILGMADSRVKDDNNMLIRLYCCRNYGDVALSGADQDTSGDSKVTSVASGVTAMEYCFAVDPNLKSHLSAAANNTGEYTYKTVAEFGGVLKQNTSLTLDGRTDPIVFDDAMRYNFYVGEKPADDEMVLGTKIENTGGGYFEDEEEEVDEEDEYDETVDEEASDVDLDAVDIYGTVSGNDVKDFYDKEESNKEASKQASKSDEDNKKSENAKNNKVEEYSEDEEAIEDPDADLLEEEDEYADPTLKQVYDGKFKNNDLPQNISGYLTKNDLYRFFVTGDKVDNSGSIVLTSPYRFCLYGYNLFNEEEPDKFKIDDDAIDNASEAIDPMFVNYRTLGADDDVDEAFLNHLFRVFKGGE